MIENYPKDLPVVPVSPTDSSPNELDVIPPCKSFNVKLAIVTAVGIGILGAGIFLVVASGNESLFHGVSPDGLGILGASASLIGLFITVVTACQWVEDFDKKQEQKIINKKILFEETPVSPKDCVLSTAVNNMEDWKSVCEERIRSIIEDSRRRTVLKPYP